jgi:hypothetical protein
MHPESNEATICVAGHWEMAGSAVWCRLQQAGYQNLVCRFIGHREREGLSGGPVQDV